MDSIVITPRNSEEMEFVSTLLTKIGLETRRLSDDLKEDMGLAYLMSQADRSDTVSVEDFKLSLK